MELNLKIFINYFDNKGPTLTLIKTTKNKIFGGFSPLSWNNNKGNICDELNQTFIFSLTSKEKNLIKNQRKLLLYKV